MMCCVCFVCKAAYFSLHVPVSYRRMHVCLFTIPADSGTRHGHGKIRISTACICTSFASRTYVLVLVVGIGGPKKLKENSDCGNKQQHRRR